MRVLKKVFFVLLTLLIIFTPVFLIFPKWTWLFSLLGVFTLLSANFTKKYGIYSRSMVFMYLMLFGSLFMSLLIPIIFETYDFGYSVLLIGLFLSILRIFFLIYIFELIFEKNANLHNYITFFIITCVLYVIISLIFIFNSEIKFWWFEKVIEPVRVVEWGVYSYRVGIDGFAAFSTASVFSIAIILNAYLLLEKHENKIKYFLIILSYLIILIGCFIYGRVSTASIIFSLIFLIFFSKSKIKVIKITTVVIGVIIILVNFILKLAEYNVELYNWIHWSFELIFVFLDTGKLGARSLEHMVNDMYFVPSFQTFLFGDGLYENEFGYYMSTDVGFMRSILFFGIIGTLFNYMSVLGILFNIGKIFNFLNNRKGIFLTFFILCSAVILESKGEAFHRVLYLIIPIYCFNYKNKYFYKF